MEKIRKYEDILLENEKLRKRIQKLENDLHKISNFDSLLENSPTNIFLFDENERFTYVNASACRLLGYKEKELLSMSFSDILDKKKREKRISSIRKLIESGKKSKNEFKLVRKDHNPVYVRLDIKTLSKDRYIAYCNDISGYRNTEIALKKSEENYRKFIDNSVLGVFKTNIKGEILFVNDATVTILKFKSREELIGSSVLTHYLDPSKREGMVELLKKHKSLNDLNVEFLTKAGVWILQRKLKQKNY